MIIQEQIPGDTLPSEPIHDNCGIIRHKPRWQVLLPYLAAPKEGNCPTSSMDGALTNGASKPLFPPLPPLPRPRTPLPRPPER